ncbi:sulfurtransferase [Paramagnetospirillum kuznetsovii]|uniref:Sulfurtransferase n=1 Tax=Paramagnetospirillum kuznetsovii TaxID=2053833 RepID=A0A364NVV1_9PROT|nr:rhodanese-like domain-containing protein [Paramagnetospirillum kuznetsovii]RAU21208.1 sulfurtransferase [Paramagnetospirillum kuznetsovii]
MTDAPIQHKHADYAGDLSPNQAWERLCAEPNAKLVDVRTQAEWSFVGVPDLATLGKQVLLVSWQVFPSMARNDAFADQLAAHGVKKDDTVLLLCRSGVRSKAAAEYLTGVGYGSAWNVSEGFEGPHDAAKHRGVTAGWKADGLPWAQG